MFCQEEHFIRVFVPMDNNQQDGYPTFNYPDGYVFLIQISIFL